MRRPIPMALWLPFYAISLTGCQSPSVQTKVITLPPPAIPSGLLLPVEGPHRPPADATQKDAALVIVGFMEALAACNADKDAIAKILEEMERGPARQND